MTCNRLAALSDEEMMAALEGDAPPGVQRHIDQCQDCTERLAHMRREEETLQRTLRRWDCPPPTELGNYYLSLLAPSQDRILRGHLDHCLRCRDELDMLRAFMPPMPTIAPDRPIAPSIQPHSGRADIFSSVRAHLLTSMSSANRAGVRGHAEGPLIAQCHEATIIIETRAVAEHGFELTGQIADEQGDQERWTGALVEARQGHSLVAFGSVDDLGSFSCRNLPPGFLEMRMTAENGPSILVEQFELS